MVMTPDSVYLWNAKRMKEELGTTRLIFSERANYFGGLWDSWADSHIVFKKLTPANRDVFSSINRVMVDQGYDLMFDFQVRTHCARFANDEVKGVFMLHYGELVDA